MARERAYHGPYTSRLAFRISASFTRQEVELLQEAAGSQPLAEWLRQAALQAFRRWRSLHQPPEGLPQGAAPSPPPPTTP